MESMKARFVPPPPMTRAPKTRNKNKFCEFHRDKGHNTYDSIHLKRQIEEAVKSRQPTYLVKEVKQSNSKGSVSKAAKKLKPVEKEKGAVIFMVQSWQRHTRPVAKVVHSSQMKISFPPLTRWRFHNYPNALWTKIIKKLYPFSREAQGLVPSSSLKRKIGDGMSTLFWHESGLMIPHWRNNFLDHWNGSSFSWNWRRPLRGGIEDNQYNKICDIVKQVTIIQSDDSCRWCCDTMDSFLVNGLRKHLDCLSLPSHYLATRWNKIVPRKLPPIEFLDIVNSQGNLHKAKDVLFTIIYTAWWELWRF
ncbi:retrotransposon gag domain-containing protein [Artemisia annua]|uniref:Retrotransposon gag domain-containing protein n=1 Tax=Artemisia annua TaxID=35608 RepID=A0A2U1KPM0_ARTAN|nr:retrotransposon gag domain-containing protein [Artemisia annua]